VRLKNQRSALFRAKGQDHKKQELRADHTVEEFVIKRLDEQIKNYAAQKEEYEGEFKRLSKKHTQIRLLKSLPGIADIHAVQLLATIVDAKRFESSGHFLSYCGLIKHEKMSGGRSYGKRSSRHSAKLKGIFKMASFSVTLESCNNPMKDLFDYLVNEKKKPNHIARHAVARRIAILSYGILKSGKKYEPYKWRNIKNVKQLSAS
jgi:transposase